MYSLMKRLQNINNWTVFFILVMVTVASSLGSAVINPDGYDPAWLSGWLQNFSTEMMGAILTFALFELVVGTRNTKKDLIIQMGSSDNATARTATEQLRATGWLTDGSLRKSNLGSANLQDVDLQSANLEYANLENANLQHAKLNSARLRHAKLRSANLQDAKLNSVTLQDADLGFANLINTYLWDVNLQNTYLWDANLQDAYLGFANLQDAKLENANLQDADLRSANLQDAKLNSTNLKNANLEYAKFNEKTVLPDAEAIKDETGNKAYTKYWTPETDMSRYTNPEHPDFWIPPYLKRDYVGE